MQGVLNDDEGKPWFSKKLLQLDWGRENKRRCTLHRHLGVKHIDEQSEMIIANYQIVRWVQVFLLQGEYAHCQSIRHWAFQKKVSRVVADGNEAQNPMKSYYGVLQICQERHLCHGPLNNCVWNHSIHWGLSSAPLFLQESSHSGGFQWNRIWQKALLIYLFPCFLFWWDSGGFWNLHRNFPWNGLPRNGQEWNSAGICLFICYLFVTHNK